MSRFACWMPKYCRAGSWRHEFQCQHSLGWNLCSSLAPQHPLSTDPKHIHQPQEKDMGATFRLEVEGCLLYLDVQLAHLVYFVSPITSAAIVSPVTTPTLGLLTMSPEHLSMAGDSRRRSSILPWARSTRPVGSPSPDGRKLSGVLVRILYLPLPSVKGSEAWAPILKVVRNGDIVVGLFGS